MPPKIISSITLKDGGIYDITSDMTTDSIAKDFIDAGYDPSEYTSQITSPFKSQSGSIPDQMGDNSDLIDTPQMKPDAKTLNPVVQNIISEAEGFKPGTVQRSRVLGDAKTLEDLLGIEPSKKLLAGVNADDIGAIVQAQDQLKNLLDFKSKGFKGQGIDTGQIMGGAIPLPFTDAEIPIVPANISEFYNQNFEDMGEASADRGEFRRKLLGVLNPVRKEVTGAAAPLAEILKFIFPTLPTESDNDLGFYQKGMGSLKESQARLQTLLDSIERGGAADVSGFKDIRNKNPDQLIEEFMDQITSGLSLDGSGNVQGAGEYGFGSLMPDTTKAHLLKKDPSKMSDEDLLKSLGAK